MATVSASSTAAANGPRPPNAELPTPPNAPRGSRASFATLKRPCSPANPCLSFALLVTFCSAPVVYFYSALDNRADRTIDIGKLPFVAVVHHRTRRCRRPTASNPHHPSETSLVLEHDPHRPRSHGFRCQQGRQVFGRSEERRVGKE